MPAPFGPVMPIRRRASTCSDAGPKVQSPRSHDSLVERRDDRARARRRADRELQHPLLARLVDLLEPGDARLHLPHLARLLLRRVDARRASDLVVVGALPHRVAHALGRPLPLGAGPRLEVGLRAGIRLVGLARVTPGHLALLEIGLVAAVVDRDRVLGEVELDDARDAPGEELAVVRDEHDAAALALDERLEPREPGEVEVVGRLVEQHEVEAAEQQRRERGPRRLAARQRGHRARRARRRGPARRASAGCGRRGPAHRWRASGRARRHTPRRPAGRRRRAPRPPPPSRASRRWRRCGGRCGRRRSRRARARAPAAASRRRRRRARSSRCRRAARPRRRAGAAGSTCPRRWRRRPRRRHPGRP